MKCRTLFSSHLVPEETGPDDEILNKLRPHNPIGRENEILTGEDVGIQ
jgi:hypothetical protein